MAVGYETRYETRLLANLVSRNRPHFLTCQNIWEFHLLGTLLLKSAQWVWIEFISARGHWDETYRPCAILKKQDLPLRWFNSLGLDEVHVEATFDKKGSIYSTLEDWIEHESDLQYMSVLFENLKLPTSLSLLKLFPKEVLEGLGK